MPEQHKSHELRNCQFFAALFAVLLYIIIYLPICQLNARLAADLTYDDVVYANDAARRLLTGAENDLFAFVRSFAEYPPHRPFSTQLAVGAVAIGSLDEFALCAQL